MPQKVTEIMFTVGIVIIREVVEEHHCADEAEGIRQGCRALGHQPVVGRSGSSERIVEACDF